MMRIKYTINPLRAIDARQKAVIVSVMLHLLIVAIFFTVPLVKYSPQSPIITITFQDESGLLKALPVPAVPTPAPHQKSIHRNNRLVAIEKAEEINQPSPVSVEEDNRVIVDDKDSVAVEATVVEKMSNPAAAVESAAVEEHAPPASFLTVPNLGGSSRIRTETELGETRFGERGAPTFVYREMPVYPALARRLGKEGRVVLQLMIDADGKLLNVEVVEAAGYGFTEASVAAARKSVYAPGYRDGIKVATRALLPVTFRLQ